MSDYEFSVSVLAEDGGPDAPLRERFATVIAYRLELLNERDGTYPAVGDWFDFLDSFDGPFAWQMTDEEFEANPPTRVDFEVVGVTPTEAAGSGLVTVTARLAS
ncbi:MAG: hypothetical protein KIT89_06570 [Microcella sp.]|uniref:hypothetical protein n=1 Tax=Microcella sp. TaxID=1913979 RepID=UPI0024C9908B|nr:hypothetical protein [Microcella sp.]UYN84813.1 MAG: hypothetical protein KIT89_06570 [Microcella sp.]